MNLRPAIGQPGCLVNLARNLVRLLATSLSNFEGGGLLDCVTFFLVESNECTESMTQLR